MRRGLEHLSYANVMSTIAVFVALGGTAVAAVKLGAGQVKNRNIADSAVTSSKIRNRSIRLADLNAEIASAKGVLGPAGRDGKDGAPGATGAAGAAGADGAAVADVATFTTPGLPRYTTAGQQPVQLYTHSWSQPADTLDELAGYATVNWPLRCTQSSSVANVVVLIDGRLATPSVAKGAADGNGPVTAPTIEMITPIATNTAVTASTAADTDFANLPLERYQFLNGPAATTHTLELWGRSSGCFFSGIGNEPTLDGTLIVRRYSR